MVNLRHAFRVLVKAPFITAVAVLSLALGIGANAAIFSMFEQVLLRPLPVHEPERLVNFAGPGPKPGSVSCGQPGSCDEVFSYPMFRDLEREQRSFTGIAAHTPFSANLAYQGQTLNGSGTLVSGSYFPVLGIQPALGRLLGPDDDEVIGDGFVAVLSHRYWEARLGSDPSVVDRSIVINGQPMTIVGVAPRGFNGTTLGSNPDVFVPLTILEAMWPGFSGIENRRSYWAYLFGRLAPGTTLDGAEAAINGVYQPIIREVDAPLQVGMSEQTLAQFREKRVALADGRRGQSSVHTEGRAPLLMMFGIAAIVLLIACANIANLLLARGASRGMEMAVRLALGAGRRRLVGQLLTEACVLALIGGAASLLVANWTLGVIASLLPADATAAFDFGIRVPIVLFAAALSIGTGLLFGMIPALHGARSDLATTMRANTGQIAGGRGAARLRSGLVIAQIALSMTLLVVAGLFIRSLMNIGGADLGLEPQNVVTFRISPQLNGYESDRIIALVQRVEEDLSSLPGVTAVSASSVPILSGSNWGRSVTVEGFERGPDTDASANFNVIGPAFFRTLRIQLLAGREFAPSDQSTTAKVAIVNEAFARKFELYPDPVGKWMAAGSGPTDLQIVGLVRDASYSDVKNEVPPQYFTPYLQDDHRGSMSFYLRTALDPRQVLPSIHGVVSAIDANLPVEDLKTLPRQIRENVALDRVIGILSASFAVVATLLAAIGLYGVLAYTVSRRTREIGVRMALGADAPNVRAMVLRQVGTMMVVGVGLGVVAALALGRAAGSLLFGLESYDPGVLVFSAIVLALVAFGAAFIPALRASRVDPVNALRSG